MGKWAILVAACAVLTAVAPVSAQDRPVPYWAALRADKVNMRVGPGEDYQISWTYQRKGLPMKVVRLMQGWRLVEDQDGARGWMLARFLTPERGAVVIRKIAELRQNADGTGKLMWRAAPGVVGKLGKCSDAGWCKFDADGRKAYVRADAVWGAGDP